MKKLSWLPIRSVILALSVLLIAAAVGCGSGEEEVSSVAFEPTTKIADDAMMDDDDAMDDDAMMDDDDAMDDEVMTDDDAVMDDDASMDDDAMMEHEPTVFTVMIENIGTVYDFSASGVGGDAPAGPGDSYSFEFDAAPGSALSFATMFVPSNDFFFAPTEDGISLYDDDGNPISGDVTDQISLWDAGTEADQEPGAGSEQPLMNGGNSPDTPDTDNTVRLAPDTFGNLPDVASVVNVNVNHLGGSRFEVVIENVSSATTLKTADGSTSAVPITPPLWVVHSSSAPLFTIGEMDRGEGLEALAETGSPVSLIGSIQARTGLTSPIAPGVFAVIEGDAQLYVNGESDQGLGLEALAEDGSPGELADSLATTTGVVTSGVFTTPIGADSPAPAFPGESYEFEFEALMGDELSFATMLVQTNDLFYAPSSGTIALFDSSGEPIDGDLTSLFLLWDAGTEVNQTPGAGADQAPRQAGPNTGKAEAGNVAPVDDGNDYPDVDAIIRVTITSQG